MLARLQNLLMLVFVAMPMPGMAQVQTSAYAPTMDTSASGLPGLSRVGHPRMVPGLAVTGDVGYGFIEPVGSVDGAQHRAVGTLAAALAPTPFFAAAIQLDGRLDVHPDDGMGTHTTGVGDPRVVARIGYPVGHDIELGGELGVWFAGASAPSFVPDATSVTGRILGSYQSGPWTLLVATGFRFDNSANSAPVQARLRPGDRIALGISDFHAVLAAVGLSRDLSPRVRLFAEISTDMLVGDGAPGPDGSPIRGTLGGRYGLSHALAFEAMATINLGSRPDVNATAPLVPFEPRFLITTGLRFGSRPEAPPKPAVAPPEPIPVRAPPPAVTTLSGQLLDDEGKPLSEAGVVLQPEAGDGREVITDAEGRYRFDGVPVGPAELTAIADGFETLAVRLELKPDMPEVPAQTLVPRPSSGVIRGLSRSFDSEPLAALVRVLNERGRRVAHTTSDADGQFELHLPPGRYQIRIDVPGYQGQRRQVTVEDRGVTILNVDLRK